MGRRPCGGSNWGIIAPLKPITSFITEGGTGSVSSSRPRSYAIYGFAARCDEAAFRPSVKRAFNEWGCAPAGA